jgi:hypothetical protein
MIWFMAHQGLIEVDGSFRSSLGEPDSMGNGHIDRDKGSMQPLDLSWRAGVHAESSDLLSTDRSAALALTGSIRGACRAYVSTVRAGIPHK